MYGILGEKSPSLNVGGPSSSSLRASIEEKRQRKGEFGVFFGCLIYLLPLDNSAPGSHAFELGLGLIPLAPLVLKPLGLDQNHTTSLPGPPTFGRQMGHLSL